METGTRVNTSRGAAGPLLNKVPQVTLLFWIVKIMATTVGETAADFLSSDLDLGLLRTTFVMGALLLTALWAQLRSRNYSPPIYWIVVVLISIVGTLITDNLVDNFGVSLDLTTTVFALALSITFAAWYASEKTLSIHHIDTPKRELFYWAAILFTFALGTAAGDGLAEGLSIGYALSTLLFGAMIAAVILAHQLFKLDAVPAFWIAYILTRPFGASFGDLLSQPTTNGGLGLGTVATSGMFLVTILVLVAAMARIQSRRLRRRRSDRQARSSMRVL
ncbi:MAG: hypothetical protein QFE16_06715 [Pseudomonadota bacterium]|nr:hypothetical protein [Pseudomonadota bacterium]